MTAAWYAGFRVLHIVCAALWVGSAVLLTVFVSPAIRASGPHGAQVMVEIMRRRMGAFLAAVGILTVLSGLWLYWVFSNGFDPAIMTHGAGLALGIGGLCGLVAVVLGGAVIGRTAERAGKLAGVAVQMPAGVERDATLQTVASLRHRVAVFSRCDMTLLLAALLAMCIAHVL